MEHAYVTFKTMVGQFDIGYQAADEWGTVFADTPGSRPRARWTGVFGPLTLIGIFEKVYEADTVRLNSTATAPAPNTPSTLTDADADNYMLAGIYNWKGGAAGLLYKYINNATNRPTANFKTQVHALLPYIKATFGPVYIEGELVWLTGKTAKYEAPSTASDIDKEG